MDLKDALKKHVSAENANKYALHLEALMAEYGIDTPLRQRHFLAQLLHESAAFTAVKENLNYSADALQRVFGKYFPNRQMAEAYARNPEKIANWVYANRMGNGDEVSGDGWRFRGRGLIQTTGKNNYLSASQALFGDDRLLKEPDILESPHGAVASAAHFWKSNNLNALADRDDIEAVTRRINGGLNGLDDRKKYYNALKTTLV